MYAVLKGTEILYLGDDNQLAVQKFTFHENDNGTKPVLVQIKDMQELAALISPKPPEPTKKTVQEMLEKARKEQTTSKDTTTEEDPFSDAAKALFETLEDLGLNSDNADQFLDDIQKNGQKAIAEVRSIGMSAMKAVGEGFIALGDLLKKNSEE